MESLRPFSEFLLPAYTNLPVGKYVNLFIVRETESEVIFRTEGSGEPINREFVHAGMDDGGEVIDRAVISKRKQTAVERRTGRALLHAFGLLARHDDGSVCMLNTNAPCERCIDCWVYGYAAGGGGAQKSRVMTEDAFSLLSASAITDTKTFNATFDTGTMRHPETGKPSHSINASEYIRPEAHFLDIEVLKDVTPLEMAYVVGNILRSSRYGAISSRIGKIRNEIVAIVFSTAEVMSTLEWTRQTYDLLGAREHPLSRSEVRDRSLAAIDRLSADVPGAKRRMSEGELAAFLDEVRVLYEAPEAFLRELDASYPKPAGKKR